MTGHKHYSDVRHCAGTNSLRPLFLSFISAIRVDFEHYRKSLKGCAYDRMIRMIAIIIIMMITPSIISHLTVEYGNENKN